MKTILEIQKLDRQIQLLKREVEKCPASVDFKNYKKYYDDSFGKKSWTEGFSYVSKLVSLCHLCT